MARRKKTTDHTTFRVVERRHGDGRVERPKADAEEAAAFWWLERPERVHQAVWDAVDRVSQQQGTRRERLKLYAALYGDKESLAALGTYARRGSETDKVKLNVCRMAVDTLSAKIAKSKPKATIATDGGNWSQQRRAKGLDKFVQGIKYQARAYPKGRQVFRDACVHDVGIMHWYREPGAICCERVHPRELLVDRADGQNGEPRCIYRSKAMHREVLKALVRQWHSEDTSEEGKAKLKALLQAVEDAASPTEAPEGVDSSELGDMVEVREAWHLPSFGFKRGEETDGRRVICVDGAALVVEDYRRKRFPFEVLRFSEALEGFYGSGVVEQLVDWQRSINLKLRKVNAALRLMASPQYWEKAGQGAPQEHYTNEVGIFIRSAFKPETLNTGVVVSPQLLDSLERDVQRALETVGVSQLSVAARKPAGLDSGAALREFNDIESERFILVGQALEEFYVGCAGHIIDLAKEAAEDKEPIEVRVDGRRGTELVHWKDVNMEADAFIIKAFPTSSLPSTPAARKTVVEEWLAAGFIDSLEARRLLDMPDLEASNNVAFAAMEDIEATVERILEGGDDEEGDDGSVYQPPEPHQDLAYGLKRFQSAYLRAKHLGAPEWRLEMLRTWMTQAEDLLASTQPPPPAAPPMAGAAPALPPGAPMAPPMAA